MPVIAIGHHGMEDDDDICIEVENKDVKGLQIGDEVEISVKGLVEKLELGDDICPAYIRLELSSRTVRKIGPNQFDKLLAEEEHEDAEPDLMDEDEDAA
jgi:hypothetical protein